MQTVQQAERWILILVIQPPRFVAFTPYGWNGMRVRLPLGQSKWRLNLEDRSTIYFVL